MMLGMYLTYFYAVARRRRSAARRARDHPALLRAGLVLHRGLLARVTGGGDPNRADGRPAHPDPRPVARDHQRHHHDPHARCRAASGQPTRPRRSRSAPCSSTRRARMPSSWRSCSRRAIYLFLTRTDLGKALRAAADDPEAASYQGIDVRAMHGLAFGVGIALVAAAGRAARHLLPDRAQRRRQLHRADVRRRGPRRPGEHSRAPSWEGSSSGSCSRSLCSCCRSSSRTPGSSSPSCSSSTCGRRGSSGAAPGRCSGAVPGARAGWPSPRSSRSASCSRSSCRSATTTAC